MRPASIVNFERFYLGAIAVGLVNTFLSWDETLALVQQPGVQLGQGFVAGAVAGSVAINLLLWYFVARRASVIAKWILVALFAFGLVSLAINVVGGTMLSDVNMVLGILAFALQAVAVWMLFRPDAQAWLAGGTTIGDG